MNIAQTPISVTARVLPPPTLRYGAGSAEATIVGLVAVVYWVPDDDLCLTETRQWPVEYVSTLVTEG